LLPKLQEADFCPGGIDFPLNMLALTGRTTGPPISHLQPLEIDVVTSFSIPDGVRFHYNHPANRIACSSHQSRSQVGRTKHNLVPIRE
jgi:hypothetical protein